MNGTLYKIRCFLLGVLQACNECFTSTIMLQVRWGKNHPKEERAENTKEEWCIRGRLLNFSVCMCLCDWITTKNRLAVTAQSVCTCHNHQCVNCSTVQCQPPTHSHKLIISTRKSTVQLPWSRTIQHCTHSLETRPSASSTHACSVRYYSRGSFFGGRRPGRFYHVMRAATVILHQKAVSDSVT